MAPLSRPRIGENKVRNNSGHHAKCSTAIAGDLEVAPSQATATSPSEFRLATRRRGRAARQLEAERCRCLEAKSGQEDQSAAYE